MAYSVLFIDDDAFMLKALLRTAKRIKPDWSIRGCDKSLHWLDSVAPDVGVDLIICDYQMPHFDGEKVLQQACECYPAALRVLLTGDISEHIVTMASRFSHHILPKPFSEANLEQLFQCVERLQQLPINRNSRERLGQIQALPVLPDMVYQLKALFAAPETGLMAVASMLEMEPILAAKLVQVANSAFMGFSRPALTIQDATVRLGARLIEAIVMLHSIDQALLGKVPHVIHYQITEQALLHGALAKKLAVYTDCSKQDQEKVFSAAIFGGIGQLIEQMQQVSELFTTLKQPIVNDAEFQNSTLNNTLNNTLNSTLNSTLISVFMLTLWGYEAELCEVLLRQDSALPADNDNNTLSLILYLAKNLQQAKDNQAVDKLKNSIETPSLRNAFERLVAEDFHV